MLGPIRLALHLGDAQQATHLLDAMEPWCESRPLLRIRGLVLRALVLEQRGQAATAQRVLHKALELAAPGDCVRAFLDEGPRVVPLLQRARQALAPLGSGGSGQDAHAFAGRLLGAAGIGAEPAPRALPAPAGEPLSERELHVLRLLCEGASNRDLAAHLAISENTVKYHLKNLNSKLGVGSRAQAIRAARERGFPGFSG